MTKETPAFQDCLACLEEMGTTDFPDSLAQRGIPDILGRLVFLGFLAQRANARTLFYLYHLDYLVQRVSQAFQVFLVLKGGLVYTVCRVKKENQVLQVYLGFRACLEVSL